MIVQWQKQTFDLLPDRAAYWVEKKTLLIADPHFGKASVFRAGGILIPSGTTETNLRRIDSLLVATKAERLLFLGDFVHGVAADNARFIKTLHEWRIANAALPIHLLVGNHDRFCGDLANQMNMICSEDLVEAPFVFKHHPEADHRGPVICGHVHPAIDLSDQGEKLRLRCFWLQRSIFVLPSFGEFTGSFFITPDPTDGVYGVGEGKVVPLLQGQPDRKNKTLR